MRALFSYISVENLSSDIAEEIYEITSPGSKLRKFCADVIAAEGPFLYVHDFSFIEIENRKTLIKKGGDLALDQAEPVGFKRVSINKPYHHSNHARYIDDVLHKDDLKEWLTGRERTSTYLISSTHTARLLKYEQLCCSVNEITIHMIYSLIFPTY
jgi:hypothetical protein